MTPITGLPTTFSEQPEIWDDTQARFDIYQKELRSPDFAVRARAIGFLAKYPQTGQALVESLDDVALPVRLRAIEGIGENGHLEAIPKLIERFAHGCVAEKSAAADSFLLMGGLANEAAPVLREFLRNPVLEGSADENSRAISRATYALAAVRGS